MNETTIKMSNGVRMKMKQPKRNKNCPAFSNCPDPVKSTINMDTLQSDMKISKVDIGKGVKEKFEYDYKKDIFDTKDKTKSKTKKKVQPKNKNN